MTPFLELTGVSKSFGQRHVLKDVNLTIAEGEFVAIVGYSGQGKTTLVSLMAGLILPTSGSVALEGKAIAGPGPDRGLVFQNYSLLPWLSVRENIALAVDQVFAEWSAEKRRDQVEKHIAMVKLSHAGDRLPRQLSGGMRQRVAVARTLAIEPRILLLDEPLSALDALTRATLQDEIAEIWSTTRKTVVLITNDVDEALLLADRIVPLTVGPEATLGPAIHVDLPRPRHRRELNQNPGFKKMRLEITSRLIGYNSAKKISLTRQLIRPEILPENLDAPRVRRPPRRPHEIKSETISTT